MLKTNTLQVSEFIGQLFRVRDISHLYHLYIKDQNKHEISEEFYTSLLGLIDELIEVYQGDIGKRIEISIKGSETVEDLSIVLETLKPIVLESKGLFNPPLQSILDDIYNLICITLYKLENE